MYINKNSLKTAENSFKAASVELVTGFEPTTRGLRYRCSAVEPHQHTVNITPLRNAFQYVATENGIIHLFCGYQTAFCIYQGLSAHIPSGFWEYNKPSVSGMCTADMLPYRHKNVEKSVENL